MGTNKLRPTWADGMKRAAKLIGTQSEAAEACDVSLRQFVKYLAGTTRPPDTLIDKLAKAANIERSEILENRGSNKQEGLPFRIREMIEVIGTQEDAAKIAGVTSRQLRMYMGETSHPSPKVLQRLADASGFARHYIVTGEGPKVDIRRDSLVDTPLERVNIIGLQKTLLLDLIAAHQEKLDPSEASALMWRTVELANALNIPQEHWKAVFKIVSLAHEDAVQVQHGAQVRRLEEVFSGYAIQEGASNAS